MPKYQNSNTGDVVEYDEPRPRLEALENWTRLDPEPGPEQQLAPPADPTERPAKNAPKDAWQAYARTRAQDSDEEAAIGDLTKDQLIELYGGEN
ncbi:hypothetical protein ACF09L_32635 [Streptomyces sp. NPDC014779]|uniref:hypothetical protein n=1 Tax=Streptomyces sp. NPDC014779 TaxID=3364911 RepID=UPI0037021DCD